MYRPRVLGSPVPNRIGGLVVAAVLSVAAAGTGFAESTGLTAGHGFHSMLPDGCQWTRPDDAQSPADALRSFATELGLTGQQQQDLQILTADYAERLRDLARLMGEATAQLMKTEPGDPGYWALAQEVSALAASSSAETVILISEMREKLHFVLTEDQRAELRRRIEELKEQCKPEADAE